jgi:hypothetical protein
MTCLLVIGFFANLTVRPVSERYFEQSEARGGLSDRRPTV